MNYSVSGDEIWSHLLDDGVTILFPVGKLSLTRVKLFAQHHVDTWNVFELGDITTPR